MTQIPGSELEAVNLMLATIGESPIATLENSGNVDATLALQTLTEISTDVQSRGWHFNTDKNYPLFPQATPPYAVIVPPNTARIDRSRNTGDVDIAIRGGKLWNRKSHSFSFEGVGGILVDIVWILPFNDLPIQARRYVAVRAARVFQDRSIGSTTLHSFTSRDEEIALAGLRKFEAKTANRSLLNSSWSVARTLWRR
jgi:hypothetical protein